MVVAGRVKICKSENRSQVFLSDLCPFLCLLGALRFWFFVGVIGIVAVSGLLVPESGRVLLGPCAANFAIPDC
jgi:hypothetical protein